MTEVVAPNLYKPLTVVLEEPLRRCALMEGACYEV